ncbi:haloacid dehalogenase type II [Pelomicrobium sp. G1]|uniref:haloacid dehalogenase type II n=1 Tax=unclassified Pelomicrobium TaxID=2815318 RepID=UPI003F75BC51
MTNRIKALVFDAYGTLYDVHSVVARCDQRFPGQGQALSQTWRQKQLEYTWLKSLMGEYEDFWAITERALTYACRHLGLACDNATRARLLNAYLHLEPYPEVAEALEALRGRPLAILSNGSPRMLLDLVRNTGLEPKFKAILSVDELKIFKPHPSVYALAPARLGVDKHEVGFVSSNYWDVVGAKAFGFHVFWINRFDATPDELGHSPDAVLKALTELTQHVR